MAADDHEYVQSYLRRSADALGALIAGPGCQDVIMQAARMIENSIGKGGKLMIAGNGGSAADSQHLAAEFLSRFLSERRPLPAIALTTDTSVLTAIGNDYGFDDVFERQVRGLGRAGDVFLGISTSGRSRNVLAALRAARRMGVLTIGFTGKQADDMEAMCDLCFRAPAGETAIIQQIHIIAGHLICGLVERAIMAGAVD